MSIYHIIYKTTNLVNNKIYIGKHKTRNKDDFYLGSGIAINRAIKKYGRESFKREILFLLNTEEEMNLKEKELVTEEFCLRKDTYNMMIGGQGGDATKAYTSEQKLERNKKLSKSVKEAWDAMPQEEKTRRGKKTQANSDQVAKGKKIAAARKLMFANETEEQRRIRISNCKNYTRIACIFCSRLLHPGGVKGHETNCALNPTSKKYSEPKRYVRVYVIKDTNGKIYETRTNKKFCSEQNIAYNLLRVNVGKIITEADVNKNATREYNTIGWQILEVKLIEV